MAAIGPGSLVKCVRAFPARASEAPFGVLNPTKGRIYTVREVLPDCSPGFDALRLVEIVNPVLPYRTADAETAFDIRGFVPLDDSRLSIFRQHLHPAPKEPVEA